MKFNMFKKFFLSACFAVCACAAYGQQPDSVCYDFATTADHSGTYAGTLHGSAQLDTFVGTPVLSLGGADGYFDLGTEIGKYVGTFQEFTISVNVFIPADADLSANGNFVWCFAKSSSAGYNFFSARDNRYAISLTNYSGEQSLTHDSTLVRGRWNSIQVFQRRNMTRLLINGRVKSVSMALHPSDVGPTVENYLGRSCYAGDAYLKGAQYADLRLYNSAITTNKMAALRKAVEPLNAYLDSIDNQRLLETFTMEGTENLIADLDLPATWQHTVSITWTTSNANVITADGHITRPVYGQPVAEAVLTAHLICGTAHGEKQFKVSVLPEFSDQEALDYDTEHLALKGHLNNLYDDLALPTVAELGSVVTWKSSDTDYLTDAGQVVRYAEGEKRHIVLTATLMRGSLRATRTFDVYLHQHEPYAKYLFVYFPSNSDENLYYAISDDGFNYKPMNNGQPFFKADTTTVMGGLRDPHILRGPDGLFYMVATDMKSALGWSSNRGLVLMKSADLIHWTHSTVHFPTRYAGTRFANVTRVWAPETIWDPQAGKFLVYFSLLTGDGTIPYDKDFYCYANADFTDLEGQPTYFYDRGSATIDMDIVYNETDSLYHGFYKTEGEGGICQVTARSLTPAPGQPEGSQWMNATRPLQQTTEDVEGGGVFKLINQDRWVLMYDVYKKGYYQFCTSPDLNRFTFEKNTMTSGAFTPRHGTVIPITADEAAALMQALPVSGLAPAVSAVRNISIRQENVTIGPEAIFLPVRPGTDLSAFDPQFDVTAGAKVSPTAPQDFTQGPVAYTVTLGGEQKTYNVTVEADANPILPGFHADPEVLFSKKTGRFYVYPTTDGYPGWGGYTFDVFTSSDLVNFTNAGTILNLSAGHDVPWATGNAWAPCIEEKFVDGKWRYYFYFSGQNRSTNYKTLGVATAETPEGPFTASSKLVLSSTSGGQMIDSDVFTDPVSGQTYFYYGNGQMHYRLLSPDMMTAVGSEYTITPQGGSLADYAYREGTYVFYRDGLYYFLWSVDDTGSANYHVAYGTSTSPTGPIQVADEPIVIIQDPSKEIYGTGHNSVVNVPGTDDWYIVYHRINKHYINNEPGVHREVCVDRLTFDGQGRINRVAPTRKGIDPVDTSALIEQLVTGIRDAKTEPQAAGRVFRVTYYTLDGRSLGTVAPTDRGLYIRQEVLSDGTVRSLKIAKN